jgi:hypothetical protein
MDNAAFPVFQHPAQGFDGFDSAISGKVEQCSFQKIGHFPSLRVGIIKTPKESASCDAPGHEPDVCDEEPGNGAFESVLPIFGKAA